MPPAAETSAALPIEGADLRDAFESEAPPTIGIEEEAMLLHPESLDLAPCAREVLATAGGDERLRLELPASQVEVASGPAESVAEAVADLREGRAALARAASGRAVPAAAGIHPFAGPEGTLNEGRRYSALQDRYGDIARRQLVCGLHVHVAIRPADKALAVYNAMRGFLPPLARLAANAPFYLGEDTGLDSIRPKVSQLLPRQGMPPALASWDELAARLTEGIRRGEMDDVRQWWWEMRLHPAFGTLEVRVADAQTTLRETGAVAAVIHCLVVRLGEKHDASGTAPDPTTDLGTLIDTLAPTAARLDCAAELADARRLCSANGASRQRAAAEDGGMQGLARWLADHFDSRGA